MSILTENSKKMLVESMRECLSDVLHESTSLTSKQATEKIKFVTESATYEQLLNITMNPHRQEKYQPAYVLEGAVAILHSACMTGRKVIGPNAITEGALKLHKKTGAVITESMLDAALAAAREGCGLKVVGKILTEATLDLNQILGLISDPAQKQIIVNYYQNPSNPAFQAPAKSIITDVLARRTAGRGASPADLAAMRNKLSQRVGEIISSGGDFKSLHTLGSYTRIKSQIDTLKNLTRPLTAQETTRLANLEKQAGYIKQALGGGSTGSKAVEKMAKAGSGNSRWGKIALGAAAIGGAGALGYQYWKNRRAMQRDMQNGIPQQ